MKTTLKNRSIATLISVFTILTITLTLIAIPLVNAHDPPYVYQTYARLHVAPELVGVGETVIIIGTQNWALPGALFWNQIRQKNVDFTITKPDGTKDVVHFDLAPDSGGSAFTTYVPTQVGEYTVRVDYGETEYTWNTANEPTLSNNNTYGDIWLASSATRTFTVQDEPVQTPQTFPLPTEYWTRPIDGANVAWAAVSSNWLAGASAGGSSISTGIAEGTRWQEDGTAPRTAHIMWTKPIEFGGMVGGTSVENAAFYSGMAYEVRFTNPIIMNGILYYNAPLGHDGNDGGYFAVDLRTGKELWHNEDPSFMPTKGQLLDYGSGNQHGTVAGILWDEAGSTWRAYDAFTGRAIFNITGVPNGGFEVYETDHRSDIVSATSSEGSGASFAVEIAGDITQYVISYSTSSDTGWLGLWSVAKAVETEAGPLEGTEWRPNGENIDASQAYLWNVTLPNLDGSSRPRIIGVIPNDILVGTSSNTALTYLPRTTQDDPWTMWAISLKPSSRGQLLWKRDYPAPGGNLTRMLTMAPVDKVNRVWTMTDFDTGQHHGYSIDNGDLLWDETTNPYEFNPNLRPMQGYAVREGVMAYGMLFVSGYGGEVLAYDTLTGDIVWKFNDTDIMKYTTGIPWGLQPLHVGAMADGMVFAFAGEHSPGTPLYPGYRNFAINATTGEKVWDIFGWSSSGLGTSIAPVAIADGFLAMYNCYDGQIYSIGKGPSQTNIAASPKVSVNGHSVLVEGSVIDIAAGTKQNEQAARFPHGVPAVSDESMTPWMEYVYQQKPMPQDVKGVDVTVSVLDPNGNFYEVGTATSTSDGTYKLMFTPAVPGVYTVVATFAGSESYWPSYASTAIGVEEAPAATPVPTPTPAPMTDTYVLGLGIGAIVAIVVIGLVIILMLRKR